MTYLLSHCLSHECEWTSVQGWRSVVYSVDSLKKHKCEWTSTQGRRSVFKDAVDSLRQRIPKSCGRGSMLQTLWPAVCDGPIIWPRFCTWNFPGLHTALVDYEVAALASIDLPVVTPTGQLSSGKGSGSQLLKRIYILLITLFHNKLAHDVM